MKTTTLNCIAFILMMLAGLAAHSQVYDLTTGKDAAGNLIPLNQPDDSWEVQKPGASGYTSVNCGSGLIANYLCSLFTVYGIDPGARWLSPYMSCPLPNGGGHTADADLGYFYYRTKFYIGTCNVTSAVFNFRQIGGDDYIDQIIVNGNVHPVMYYGPAFGVGDTFAISPGEILPTDTNEIVVRMSNTNTHQGILINGNLTITGTTLDPSFSLSYTNGIITGITTGNGSHAWKVFSSPSGIPGTYTLDSIYAADTLLIPAAERCYYVQHVLHNACGDACASQSICRSDCSEGPNPCQLAAPRELTFDGHRRLSWSAVTGASSYLIEIIPGDPACCSGVPGGPDPVPVSYFIPVYGTMHMLDFAHDLGIEADELCFSWRVYPVCPGGIRGTASNPGCAVPGNLFSGLKTADTEMNVQLSAFPNPVKGFVSIGVAAEENTVFNITVSDMNGRIVKTFSNVKTNGKAAVINWNTEGLAKGPYLIKAECAGYKPVTGKLIIE